MNNVSKLIFVFLISCNQRNFSDNKTPEAKALISEKKLKMDSLIMAEQEEDELRNIALIGKPYNFHFTLKDGKVITSKESHGKVVFINFWFANCQPCITEFKAINQLFEKFKNNRQVEFIGFTFENDSTIERIREQYGLKYKIISVSQSECRILNPGNGFPTNIIVDKSGVLSFLKAGGEDSEEKADKFFLNVIYPKILECL